MVALLDSVQEGHCCPTRPGKFHGNGGVLTVKVFAKSGIRLSAIRTSSAQVERGEGKEEKQNLKPRKQKEMKSRKIQSSNDCTMHMIPTYTKIPMNRTRQSLTLPQMHKNKTINQPQTDKIVACTFEDFIGIKRWRC